MNKMPFAYKSPNHRSHKLASLLIILLVSGGLSATWLQILSQTVSAGSMPQTGEQFQAGPTPTAPSTNPNNAPRTSPVIGILVLLAPLVFLAWKSRGKKEPQITSSCCLPVIDENKRPFQIPEEQPAGTTPAKQG